jgi:hypothetical protein
MSNKEYVLGFKDAHKAEAAVREFLLEKCDILRLTMVQHLQGCLFPRRIGGENDPAFIHTLDQMKKDFIEDEVNSLKYNNIEQGGRRYRHYYYHLSPQLKAMLNEETILWEYFPDNPPGPFYGFEDPTFCLAHESFYEIVGSVITHEPYINLYLEPEEKALIDKILRSKDGAVEWC